MIYPFYLILGILPSIIWLLFFLREDAHPESNRMILRVFSYGILAAFLAIIFEVGFAEISLRITFSVLDILIINTFIGVSFIEEFSKYIVVKKIAISDSEFDEPLDAMLYMVIVGLGFAAAENVLLLFAEAEPILDTMILTLFRFLGATFLHALCSGIIGFFLALSLFESKKKFRLLFLGIIIATSLHGLYNFSIIKFEGSLRLLVLAILLSGLGIIVLLAFKKLKTIASVCKLR